MYTLNKNETPPRKIRRRASRRVGSAERHFIRNTGAAGKDSHDRSRDQEKEDFYARGRRQDEAITTREREPRTHGRGKKNDPIRIEEEDLGKGKRTGEEEGILSSLKAEGEGEGEGFHQEPAYLGKGEKTFLSELVLQADLSIPKEPAFPKEEEGGGEISFIEKEPASASAVAASTEDLLRIDRPFSLNKESFAIPDWTLPENRILQAQLDKRQVLLIKTNEQHTQTDDEPEQRELVPARRKYNLKLATYQDLLEAWEAVKGLDPNAQFREVSSALLGFIEKVYENGGVLIRETLTTHGASTDTFAYLDYLERNRDSPLETWETFSISKIENVRLSFLKREIGFLNLLRLGLCKREVIEAIRQVLLLPCGRKTYSNNIRLFPSRENPHEVKYSVGKFKPVAGQPPFRKEVAIQLFSQLKMAKEESERFFRDNVGDRWLRNQFDPAKSRLFHLRLVEGFMDPTFPSERTFFHHYALKGAFFLGEGEVDIRYLRQEEDGKIRLNLQSENGTSPAGLRACSSSRKGNVTLTEGVTVKFFLNNTSHTSRRGDLNPPRDAGKLLLALSHQVVDHADVMEEEKEEKEAKEEKEGKEEKREFLRTKEEAEAEAEAEARGFSSPSSSFSESQSFLPASLNGEKAAPTFYKLERSGSETSFKNVYSLLNGALLNNTSMARDYLESLLKRPGSSLDIEANLFIEGLTPDDDVSIYLDWTALEAPPEHMICLGLTNVLASQARSQIKNETIHLQSMIRTSPYSASLTKALAILLDKMKK